MARWWVASGTEVLFPSHGPAFIFVNEQFWGRAARASLDSQESGRLLIVGVNREPVPPRAYRRYLPIHSA
jgi:hypothetical protein